MIKGRQVAWVIYKHFKLSDEDGAMLEWDEMLHVNLRGATYSSSRTTGMT